MSFFSCCSELKRDLDALSFILRDSLGLFMNPPFQPVFECHEPMRVCVCVRSAAFKAVCVSVSHEGPYAAFIRCWLYQKWTSWQRMRLSCAAALKGSFSRREVCFDWALIVSGREFVEEVFFFFFRGGRFNKAREKRARNNVKTRASLITAFIKCTLLHCFPGRH